RAAAEDHLLALHAVERGDLVGQTIDAGVGIAVRERDRVDHSPGQARPGPVGVLVAVEENRPTGRRDPPGLGEDPELRVERGGGGGERRLEETTAREDHGGLPRRFYAEPAPPVSILAAPSRSQR